VKTKVKFTVGVGIIVASLVALAVLGARDSKTYYHTIAELPSLQGASVHQRMRIGGTVQPGSIERVQGRIDFILLGEGKSLPVSYVGSDPLPDTFVDNSQALVEGHTTANGRFVAERVQAKCASKYEATPGQPAPKGADYSNTKS
jgi:cytochrome c-type biogenesis protein CcmE